MLKARNNFVLAEVVKETRTEGGFILPENGTQNFTRARITSVGEDVTKFKEGQVIILTHTYSGFKYKEVEYAYLEEDKIALMEE